MEFLPLEVARAGTGSKVIHSRLLNRLGIQVLRAAVARGFYRAVQRPVSEDVAGPLATLRSEGVVAVPEFLEAEAFGLLCDEAHRIWSERGHEARRHDHGGAMVEHLSILHNGMPLASHFGNYLRDKRVRELIEGAEKRRINWFRGLRALERVRYAEAAHDRESELHTDIFFHTHKAWLYLTDVEREDGPLGYVRGSHAMTPARLRYEYRESVGENRPSRRITAEEMSQRALNESVMTCKANTLVVANTCGYHRRLPGKPGRQRHALIMGFRFNPFTLPLNHVSARFGP